MNGVLLTSPIQVILIWFYSIWGWIINTGTFPSILAEYANSVSVCFWIFIMWISVFWVFSPGEL